MGHRTVEDAIQLLKGGTIVAVVPASFWARYAGGFLYQA